MRGKSLSRSRHLGKPVASDAPHDTFGDDCTYRDADHSYWIGLPGVGKKLISVTQVFVVAGMMQTRFFTAASAERGTFLHLATEYYDRDDVELDESELDDALRPYLDAYKQFVDDCNPAWTAIEERLADPALGIAGTVDRVGAFTPPGEKRRSRVVLDIKSTNRPGSPFHALQTAAYAHLVSRKLVAAGKVAPQRTSKSLIDRYVLYVNSKGKYRLVEHTDVTDIAVFMGARSVALWKLEHGLVV